MRVAALVLLLGLACYGRQSDALSIDAVIQFRHLPFGGILDPIFSSSDSQTITGYTRCGDSALWTGHYLAAEAYRYQVSGVEKRTRARGQIVDRASPWRGGSRGRAGQDPGGQCGQ